MTIKTINSTLLRPYISLLHAFSTKQGGYSKSKYFGNNLAFHVNDDLETVKKNHIYFSKELGYPSDRLVHMNQIHGNSIVIINSNTDLKPIPQCDAIITNLKNTPLMVLVADCIPILIYDPVKEVVSAVHAGRTGIFSKILPNTIQKMKENYKSELRDLLIVLGPSIHQCCYEVGSDVKKETIKNGYEYAIETKDSKYYLGLEHIVSRQLEEIGIKVNQIEYSSYCTSCNNDMFYSYRAEKNVCGRFCGLIMLK